MTIADASESQVGFIEEVTFGVTPATPTYQLIRITAEDLTGEQQSQVSNELRPDAEVGDLIRLGESATGTLPFEISYGSEWDTIFEHALRATFAADQLKAAVEKKSMTWQKKHETGVTDYYFDYNGVRVGSLDMTFRASEIATGSLGLLGLGEAVSTTPPTGTTPANLNDVMAAPDVGTITVGGVTGQMFYTEISFSLNNNLRAQNALGSIPAIGIGYGRRETTGTITAYFENNDLYEEAVNNNAVAIGWSITDGTNTYTFTLPRVKFTTRRAVAGGNNQDVLAELGFQALLDQTAGTSIIIDR